MGLLPEHKESLHTLKKYLFATGYCYTSFQIENVWGVFKDTIIDLGINSAEFWVATDNDPENMIVYQLDEEDKAYETSEYKRDLLEPIVGVSNFVTLFNKKTEFCDSCHFLWAEFKSPNNKHRAGAELIIFDSFDYEKEYCQRIFIEVGLLLEVFFSRIQLRDYQFAKKLKTLTPREMGVMSELVKGQSRAQTAYNMGIAVETYDNHLRAIKRKLGDAKNRRPALELLRSQMAANGNSEHDFTVLLKHEIMALTTKEKDILDAEVKELKSLYDASDEELSFLALEILFT